MASVSSWCDCHGSVQSALNMKHDYIYMSTTHRASLSCFMHNMFYTYNLTQVPLLPHFPTSPRGNILQALFFSAYTYRIFFSANSFRITVQIIAIHISIVSIKYYFRSKACNCFELFGKNMIRRFDGSTNHSQVPSDLSCCVCLTSFERCLTLLCTESVRALWASSCFRL